MELSNKTHLLIGSYVFCKNKKVIYKEQIICEMAMRSLSKQEIEDYIKLDKPFNSCGHISLKKMDINFLTVLLEL